jgi:hypothetical protein
MQIVDVSTGQTIASSLLESRSEYFIALSGTSPEALRPRLIGDHVDGLY